MGTGFESKPFCLINHKRDQCKILQLGQALRGKQSIYFVEIHLLQSFVYIYIYVQPYIYGFERVTQCKILQLPMKASHYVEKHETKIRKRLRSLLCTSSCMDARIEDPCLLILEVEVSSLVTLSSSDFFSVIQMTVFFSVIQMKMKSCFFRLFNSGYFNGCLGVVE